jgi:hypothetical protein
MFARIDQNTCVEFVHADPAGRYHPEIIWMEVPEALKPYVDAAYCVREGSIQPPSLEYLAKQLKARVKARRQKAEASGTILNDMVVETDRESQAMLIGAVEHMRRNPDATLKWQMPDLSFVELDKAQIDALADVVSAHVQACFFRQAEICTLIEAAGTSEAMLAAYNDNFDTGWPGQEA